MERYVQHDDNQLKAEPAAAFYPALPPAQAVLVAPWATVGPTWPPGGEAWRGLLGAADRAALWRDRACSRRGFLGCC